MTSQVAPLACILVILVVIHKHLYKPFFTSPLRTIPAAHPLARFTSAWIIWVRWSKRENRELLRQHRRLGPVILIGPNEISVNCVDDGIKTVYSGGWEKPSYYDQFANYGIRTMFSSPESKQHSLRKRLISHVYSKSHLMGSPFMKATSHEVIQNRLIPILGGNAAKNTKDAVEMHELFHAVTMDLFTGYAFGLRSGTNFVQDRSFREYWRSLYRQRTERNIFTQELAPVATFAAFFGIHLVSQQVPMAIKALEDWFMAICNHTGALLRNGELEEGEAIVYRNLVSGVQKEHQMAKKQGLTTEPPDEQGLTYGRAEPVQSVVAAEILDQCLAAHETSAIILTYFTYHLSRNPEWQDRLIKELRDFNSSNEVEKDHLAEASDLDKLPVMHALLMETLRLQASIPGAQPRVSPHGTFSQLAEHQNIPGGVRVNAQAYTLHREEAVFPRSDEWLPDRWLVDETSLKEMYRWFWAFSSGGRMCIGSNLAMMEMKAVIAAIWSQFCTILAKDDGLEQEDGYTVGPINECLLVRFSHQTQMTSEQAQTAPQVSTRVSIAWNGQAPFENTDTLTLTGPNGHYLDLRVFKGGLNSGQLEWGLAGRAVDIGADSQGRSRIHFQSVIDSHRSQMPKEVRDHAPPDIGSFSDLPNGDALESGSMVNIDANFEVQPYEEVWHRLDVPTNAPCIVLESVSKSPKTFLCRLDRWSLAILKSEQGFGAWRYDCEDGEWRRKYSIRTDLMSSIPFQPLSPSLGKVGDTVTVIGQQWTVLESAS